MGYKHNANHTVARGRPASTIFRWQNRHTCHPWQFVNRKYPEKLSACDPESRNFFTIQSASLLFH